MSKIQVMSENLANRIAAGEVVEKCSSIVKELVENSIDAHASDITIDLRNGGLEEIKVTDNGDGMESEDALLAFGRHATSKLFKEDDLFFIDTLGFRGEALPSIASVSEVELKTCATNIGTYVHIKGGEVLEVKPSDARVGSIFTISNLFYNTPARLKYLKSEQTELQNCIALIEKIALSYPKIRFMLTNNGRTLVRTSGSDDLLKTIHEIYGGSISSKMIEVSSSNDDYDVYGYICKPEILKSNRNHMITIVNGRVVRNNDLNRAINDAYYTYKPDIKYPIVILKIETDPTLIDVNIHPTKQDIKLSKAEALYTLIVDMIKKALYENLLIPTAKTPLVYNDAKEDIIHTMEVREEKEEEKTEVQATFDFSEEKEKTHDEVIVNEELKSLKLYPVGLALGTYIIAQNEDGVYIIDQHAAQERINYERYLKALKEKEVHKIALLFPLTIELSSSEFIAIKNHLDLLTNMGFTVEEFGVNTFVFKEHPTWLKEGYEEESIRKILDLIVVNKDKFDVIKFNEHIAITLACKMSIKANMRITEEAMEEILDELVKTDNPYNCPHGRPTIIKFSIYDMERMFKRVMN